MELRGEDRSNPSLRKFFFQAEDAGECDSWSSHLLSDRHGALLEEREAYRELQAGFSQQLNACNNMLDEAEKRQEEAEEETYKQRSKVRESLRNMKRPGLL